MSAVVLAGLMARKGIGIDKACMSSPLPFSCTEPLLGESCCDSNLGPHATPLLLSLPGQVLLTASCEWLLQTRAELWERSGKAPASGPHADGFHRDLALFRRLAQNSPDLQLKVTGTGISFAAIEMAMNAPPCKNLFTGAPLRSPSDVCWCVLLCSLGTVYTGGRSGQQERDVCMQQSRGTKCLFICTALALVRGGAPSLQ